MNSYHLAKWFFDALDGDGTYVFGYLSIVEFGGYRTARLSLHAADADGTMNLGSAGPMILRAAPGRGFRGPAPLRDGSFEIGPDLSRLVMRTGVGGPNGAEVDLRYEADFLSPATPLTMSPDGRRRLLWLPVMPKARVFGEFRIGDRNFELGGQAGYLDYVSSDVLPPRAPVETLHWGRLHSERCDLSWTHVRWRDRVWSRLTGRLDGAPFEADGIEIADSGNERSATLNLDWPTESRLTVRAEDLAFRMGLRRECIAFESGFLAPEEAGARLFSPLLRRWAKDPRGIKYFSRADLEIAAGGKTVVLKDLRCIDEYVKFRA